MIIGQYELLNDALRNGSFPFPRLNVVNVFWSKKIKWDPSFFAVPVVTGIGVIFLIRFACV